MSDLNEAKLMELFKLQFHMAAETLSKISKIKGEEIILKVDATYTDIDVNAAFSVRETEERT